MEKGNNEDCANKGIKRKETGDADMLHQFHSSNANAHNSTSCTLSSIPLEHGYRIVSLSEWLAGWKNKQQQQEVMLEQTAREPTRTIQPSLPLPLVDLRPKHEFEQRHLSLASIKTDNNTNHDITAVPIVNLPLLTLLNGERSCELPPRHVEFAILIPRIHTLSFTTDESAKPASSSIHQFFFATSSKTTHQSRKPWLVRQVLMEDEQYFWNEAESLDLLLEKKQHPVSHDMKKSSFQKMDRLWKPDTLVSSDILSLLKEWLLNNYHTNKSNSFKRIIEKKHGNEPEIAEKPPGLVLDLGSGAGRDICFLAEELKQFHYSIPWNLQNQSNLTTTSFPLQFVGIDNHKGSSKRCLPLWKHRGVEDVTQAIHLDLNKLKGVYDLLNSAISTQSLQCGGRVKPILCIFAIRYLNRKLFSYLAHSSSSNSLHLLDETLPESIKLQIKTSSKRKQKLQHPEPPRISLPKGTIIAISHFCKPHPNVNWNFDHPKESHVLERWELNNMFTQSVVAYTSVGGGAAASDDACSKGEVKCWKILKDDIGMDGDHGRSLIQFVAVKIV
ncbi:hypothetical protein ACHAW6_010605 [Cyclotella cf. meneghiniana]